MSVKDNLNKIKSSLKDNVTLVAVSKTKPMQDILEAYNAGQRIFGENRINELREKMPAMPKDIEWHMIGHLQTNKVKYIAEQIDMIHSVDSLKLLETINTQAKKYNRTIKCLLQFHIAQESAKFGLSLNECRELMNSETFSSMKNIEICGVMGMATFTPDEEEVREEFKNLKTIFDNIKSEYFENNSSFKEVSMGMSGDYTIAIEEGSTMVRIGSTIFGARY